VTAALFLVAMRAWMIPWLFPLAILVLVIVFAVAPDWVAGLVALALLFVAVPLAWRTFRGVHPERKLPDWLPGGRPPR
jgi:hypothetical protein